MKTSSNNSGVRLQKVIADRGLCSRRKAELLIEEGKVSVNGVIVRELGVKVEPNDVIAVNGKLLSAQVYEYYLLNKPKGILSSSSDDRGRDTVVDLISSQSRLYPVGRLDKETTGALIITNDGEFTNLMTHPRFHVQKTYHVAVKGVMSDGAVQKVQRGFRLEGDLLQPAVIEHIKRDPLKKRTQFDLTLREGKNRQIRRMMEYLGYDVLKLHRISIDFLSVDSLQIGQYRALKPFEVKKLKALSGTK